MRNAILALLLSIFALPFGQAHAGVMSPDPTGLWYDPNESGWGLSVTQQRDNVFAVMFVYDASGQPAWYVASELRSAISTGPTDIVTGYLYRTSGPWFGAASFDPRSVTARSVGTLTMAYSDYFATTLTVRYHVDGVSVVKQVQRQTWRDQRTDLAGHYQGRVVLDSSPPGCPSLAIAPASNGVPAFNITAATAPGDIHISWGTGLDTVCLIDGTYTQLGQIGSIAGTLRCGPINAPTFATPAALSEVTQNSAGMTARMTFGEGNCGYAAHLGGVRIP